MHGRAGPTLAPDPGPAAVNSSVTGSREGPGEAMSALTDPGDLDSCWAACSPSSVASPPPGRRQGSHWVGRLWALSGRTQASSVPTPSVRSGWRCQALLPPRPPPAPLPRTRPPRATPRGHRLCPGDPLPPKGEKQTPRMDQSEPTLTCSGRGAGSGKKVPGRPRGGTKHAPRQQA